MNIEELERLAKAANTAPRDIANVFLFREAANPDAILALISDSKSRRNMLDMVINSVAAALERAGIAEVDDPGEAIDVLVSDKDAEIARLRDELEYALDGLDKWAAYSNGPDPELDTRLIATSAALNKEPK